MGRYRCPKCGVFGYKPKPVTNLGGYKVVPYKCRICSAPAIAHDPAGPRLKYVSPRKEWRCGKHRIEQ